jgi:hypothetical protein
MGRGMSADHARCSEVEPAFDTQFKMRRTKKMHTAGLLAIKYGITPKAVRDIWTRKSWAKKTRPHWNN